MATAANVLQLVVQADTDQANQALGRTNKGLSGIEASALRTGRAAASGLDQISAGAQRAAGGLDSLSASMARGVAQGGVYLAGLVQIASKLKEWTVEATKLAARNETLQVVNQQLAKANGYNGEVIERLVERIKTLGITTQASRDTVNQMIAAQLDLTKAIELARMAQDAAVVSGQNSSDTLQGLIHGITTQQTEVLRTYGINVDFQKKFAEASRRMGRDLTEVEKRNVALQAVLEQAPKIHGAYEASLSTVGKQLSSLARIAEEAKDAIGKQFLGEMKLVVKGLTELAQWVRENADSLGLFLKMMGGAAAALAFQKFVGYLKEAGTAWDALTLAIARNPFGALAVAVSLAGTAIYHTYQRTQELTESLWQQYVAADDAAKVMSAIAKGQTLEDLKRAGYTIDQIKTALQGARNQAQGLAEVDFSHLSSQFRVISLGEQEKLRKQLEEELAKEIGKHQIKATIATREALEEEQKRGLAGMARWRSEAKLMAEKLSTFTDDKGQIRHFTLNAEALANIERTVTAKLYNDLLDRVKDRRKKEADIWRESLNRETEAFIEAEDRKAGYAREINEEMLRLSQERFRRLYDIEQAQVERARDAALLDLEAVNAQTLREKLWVEDRKLSIERDYATKALDIQLRKIETEKQAEIAKWKLKAWLAGKDLDSEEVKGYVRDIELTYQQQIDMLKDAASAADIQRVKETEIAKGRIVVDHQRQIYESLKRQAEGVFDALLTKSQSVWSAIGNSLKTALLTALKDVVSSRVAAMLMQLFTGARVSFAGSGSRIGGLVGIGAVPVFAGSAGPIPGGSAGGWSTPPYVPSGPGGWAGLGAGLRSFNWLDAAMLGGSVLLLGGLSRRNALMTVAGASLGLARLGIAGTQLGMVGGAGAGLALAGLMRGGLGGLAMSTAGGAILGWQFGGPLGAAIGAGVGAVAGLFRSLFKSAEEKARERIKATYGVEIRDKVVLRQIVEMAKQGFAGNLDMAIRSQQIRDLIELYALSTGQSTSGLPATVRPVSLLQQGGGLFQSSSGGLTLDRIGNGVPSSAAGPTVINITVPGAKEFFEKETVRVVVENPRAVQAAAMTATKASAGRREMTGLQLSPGLVLS